MSSSQFPDADGAPPGATSPSPATADVVTVSNLNRLVRQRLESSFSLLWVSGEISNLTMAASGHVYFSLKDESAQVRCVMFRNKAQLAGFRLANGQRIEARVLVTLYEARGDYQLNVEAVRRAGQGNLHEQFLRLKAKLEAEGLFAAERKRPLPTFPRRLGIVTSLQAAALRDVLTTLRRRSPQLLVTIFPTAVQGEGAAGQIAAAIAAAADQEQRCDVLLVCRGGGSLEDLWSFNEEVVVRAIAVSPIPVISGVGHETDITLSDFAADQRAPTPTAAAEMAAPAREDLWANLAAFAQALSRRSLRQLRERSQQLDWLARRLQHPAERLAGQRQTLQQLQQRLRLAANRTTQGRDQHVRQLSRRLCQAAPEAAPLRQQMRQLAQRLQRAAEQRLHLRGANLQRLAGSLSNLNPEAVLSRGYALVTQSNGRLVQSPRQLRPQQQVTLHFASGSAQARIEQVQSGIEPANPGD